MAPFKVAIVGGGMTGLTAALHLDRLDIDFILLEAYEEITPEVGASLALYPNFQRALDQLGVLEDAEHVSSEGCTISARQLDGKPMYEHEVADSLHAATGGYGIATFTRSQLLQILHKHISDEGKRRIHTNARVSRIEQLPGDEGVRLHMKDGQTHDADIVIGADGTHSIVRSEMWRMAEEAGSKAFVDDKGADAKTEFACAFGLSSNTGDLRKDYCYQVSGPDMCIGLFGGAKGEALWFIFFKVDEERRAKTGLDFPRWTQEEGEAVCEKYSDARFTDNTTFGDVYANRYRLTTQACPNHTLKRWHFGRLICLGDSVAKTNPILAQGGAQGAESVLMLVDNLQGALKERESGTERLPTSKLESILADVNAKREPRVREFVQTSQIVMRTFSWSGWLFHFLGKWLLPLLPTSIIVGQALAPWKGSYQSTTLPPPQGSKRATIGHETVAKREAKVDIQSVAESTT